MMRAIRAAKSLGVVTVAAAVLSLSADSASGVSPGGSKVIGKSGQGTSVQSTSTSSNGNTGDCSKLRLVVVSATVSDLSDSLTVTTRCVFGGVLVPVASATAPDADGFAFDVQENGTGSHRHTYMRTKRSPSFGLDDQLCVPIPLGTAPQGTGPRSGSFDP